MEACVCAVGVVCIWGSHRSVSFYSYIFCIEETTEAHDRPLHPPTQRIPVRRAAWGAPDFLTLPRHTFFLGSVWNWACVSGIWMRRERGGDSRGRESMGVGIRARWNDKNARERAWSIFASLPVLTFKMLNHGPAHKERDTLWKAVRRMDSDLLCYRCELHAANCFPRCVKSSSFGNLNTRLFSSYNRRFNYSLIVE